MALSGHIVYQIHEKERLEQWIYKINALFSSIISIVLCVYALLCICKSGKRTIHNTSNKSSSQTPKTAAANFSQTLLLGRNIFLCLSVKKNNLISCYLCSCWIHTLSPWVSLCALCMLCCRYFSIYTYFQLLAVLMTFFKSQILPRLSLLFILLYCRSSAIGCWLLLLLMNLSWSAVFQIVSSCSHEIFSHTERRWRAKVF